MDYAISHHTVFMPAGEYIRKYRDEDKFIVFCRRCNRYDRCWACPPYDFDISARIGKYKYICITGTQIVPDPSSVPTIPAGTEKEVVIGLLTEVRLQLDSWLRWLETEYPGSLACYARYVYPYHRSALPSSSSDPSFPGIFRFRSRPYG